VQTTVVKIAPLTPTAGLVYSGMGTDTRVLVRKGRKAAQAYRLEYGCDIPVAQLTRELAQVMQEYTQEGGVRPFGVSLLLAGCDREPLPPGAAHAAGGHPMAEGGGGGGGGADSTVGTPQLFQVDPSGSYWAWRASAIGKNMYNAKTFLEKRYRDDLELEDCIHTAILTLKEGFEGKMTEHNIEVAVVDAGKGGFRVLTPAEIKDYLGEVE
jgi:20S proteasome subunit alpha 2